MVFDDGCDVVHLTAGINVYTTSLAETAEDAVRYTLPFNTSVVYSRQLSASERSVASSLSDVSAEWTYNVSVGERGHNTVRRQLAVSRANYASHCPNS